MAVLMMELKKMTDLETTETALEKYVKAEAEEKAAAFVAMRSPDAVRLLRSIFRNHNRYLWKFSDIPWDMTDDHVLTVLKTLFQLADEYNVNIINCIFKKASLQNLKLVMHNGLINPQKLLSCQFVLKDPAMIIYLIKEGADINNNCLDGDKKYSLHYEMEAKTVQFLLQLGADTNVVDKFDKTPFSFHYYHCINDIAMLMMKHLASVISTGGYISEADLLIIRTAPNLQKFYDKCIVELDKMKTMNAINDLQYHYLFSKTSYQISMHLRNTEMFKQFRNSLLQSKPDVFPIFKADMIQKLGLARQISKSMESREQELTEVFSDIFNTDLPWVIVRKIVIYSFDFVGFEREYYAAHFGRTLLSCYPG